jgi:peptidyl-tRNA hydrolase
LFTKITVGCNSEKELLDAYNLANKLKLPTALIQDEGLTEFKSIKTKTCIAIGPANVDIIDEVTGSFKLL